MSIVFAVILIGMVVLTVRATLDRGMLDAGRELMQHPWFVATLADAYAAFLACYLWVAWHEPTWPRRVVWFVLIMSLGSIAISAYVLLQLRRGRLAWPRESTSSDV